MVFIVLSAQVTGNRTLKQAGPVYRGHASWTATGLVIFCAVGAVGSLTALYFGGALFYVGFAMFPIVYLLSARRKAVAATDTLSSNIDSRMARGKNWYVIGGIPAAVILVIVGAATAESWRPAPDRPADAVMPAVAGQSLDDVTDSLRELDLRVDTTDDTGKNRMVIVDGNWIVTSQDPEPGQELGDLREVTLGVVKKSDAADDEPSDETESKAVPSTAPESAAATARQESSALAPTTMNSKVATTATPTPLSVDPSEMPVPEATEAVTDERTATEIENLSFLMNLDLGEVPVDDSKKAVVAGRTACDALQATDNPAYMVLELVAVAQKQGFSRHDSEYFVGAAIAAFCDEYTPLVTN
jgi:hypothetical protein